MSAHESPQRPPSEQWWTINGQELMDALTRAHNGDVPAFVYLELLANSDGTDYGTWHELDDVASEFGVDLNDSNEPLPAPYSRAVLEQVVIYHYQRTGPAPYTFSCGCGWGTRSEHLGKSYAGHIADVYEASITGGDA